MPTVQDTLREFRATAHMDALISFIQDIANQTQHQERMLLRAAEMLPSTLGTNIKEGVQDIRSGLAKLNLVQQSIGKSFIKTRRYGLSTKVSGQYTSYAKYKAAARLRSKMSTATMSDKIHAIRGSTAPILVFFQSLFDANAKLKALLTLYNQILSKVQALQRDIDPLLGRMIHYQDALSSPKERRNNTQNVETLRDILITTTEALTDIAKELNQILQDTIRRQEMARLEIEQLQAAPPRQQQRA